MVLNPKARNLLSTVIILSFVFFAESAFAAKVGQKLNNLTLKNAKNKPAKIPGFGKKIITVIYGDMQSADDNDPVADAIKAKNYDRKIYDGIGVANLKDSWAPNFVIRAVVRKKMKKYDTVILTDDELILPKKWGFGECDDKSIVVVISKDKKVLYAKKGKIRGAEIQKVIGIIDAELKKNAAEAK